MIADLKREKAAQLAYDTAAALMAKREENEDLDSLATKYEPVEGSLKKRANAEETDFFAFSAQGYIAGIGAVPSVMANVFSMQPGDVRGPIQSKILGTYIVQLVERQEADLASLEANQEEWLKLYSEILNQKKSRIYQSWLNSVKAHSRIERVEPQLAYQR